MRSRAIEQYKQSLKLSQELEEVLVGVLLGDACLESQNGGRTFRLKIEQSAQHEAYVRHLYALFGPWVLSPPRFKRCKASNGATSMSWAFSTVSHVALCFHANQFYEEQGKHVPELIHRWLTPRGLAYWYMDDGSMKSEQSKGVIFNTQGFQRPDVERLIATLQTQFALSAKLRHQKDGWQIYLSGTRFERFLELVEPWILAEMRYKLPAARRTHLPKE
jgi:hypothetical protein